MLTRDVPSGHGQRITSSRLFRPFSWTGRCRKRVGTRTKGRSPPHQKSQRLSGTFGTIWTLPACSALLATLFGPWPSGRSSPPSGKAGSDTAHALGPAVSPAPEPHHSPSYWTTSSADYSALSNVASKPLAYTRCFLTPPRPTGSPGRPCKCRRNLPFTARGLPIWAPVPRHLEARNQPAIIFVPCMLPVIGRLWPGRGCKAEAWIWPRWHKNLGSSRRVSLIRPNHSYQKPFTSIL